MCVDDARDVFAKNVEVRNTFGFGAGQHRRYKSRHEFGIDEAGGVDAKAVNAVVVDPGAKNLNHAFHDARIFGHDIVEADKIAARGAFAVERGVAAVMVIKRVVEPIRPLYVLFAFRHGHRIGVVGIGEARKICFALNPVAEEAVIDRRPVHTALARIRIVRRRAVRTLHLLGAFLVFDDVGRVVDDDVHVELHAPGMNRIDQLLELGIGPEVRIDVGEIGDPVAVIAGRFIARIALHRLVLEHRGEPHRGGP